MSEIADSKRGRPRLLLVGKVLLLIVVIALAGFGLSRTKNEQRPVDPFTVQRGDLDVALVAGSTAMSLAPQHIQVEVSSDEGIQVLKLLEEGHLITKEDIANRLVLAEFDSARIEQRIMDYELYYESAVSAFADAEQFLEVMGRINDSLLRSAERKVRFAAMDLRKYLGEALADEIIGKVNRQFAAESALEGLRQAVADEVAAQEKAKQAAQAAADARASGTEEPLPATESALAVPAEVLSEPAPFAVQEGKRGDHSSSTEAESLGARYGFAEDVRTPEELEAEAAIAAEAAEAASRLVEQARGEFESALQAVGLDTNAFTGDVHEWTIEFDPVDFHALGQDPRLGGAAALEREKLRTDIMLDQEALLMAQRSLEGSEKLFANQFIPETELEKERLSYNRMKVTLDMKSENERLFFLFDFPKASEQAYADYEEALRSLDRTKRTSRTRLLNAQVNYLSALMRLQYRQEARRRNQIQLSKYKIYAEQEGLLIYGESGNENRDWDEQIKEGMFVREGMILFTIPDLTRMAFRMKIHESEIDKVKMNQQVQIRVEAFPDERVEGVISKVGVLPSSMSSYFNPEMRLYDVVATVASVHDWIRPGMTAEVRIAVDTVEDALLAPITAVSTRGGEAFCFLATGQRRVVETGNFNDEFIEIRSGLEEGEIIAADPRPFLDGIDDGSGEIKLWMPESMKAQAAE